jgi:signal peptidase I
MPRRARVGAARKHPRFHAAPTSQFSIRRVPRRARTLRWVITAAVVVGGALLVRSSFSVYRVASASMEPALHCSAAPNCRRLEDDRVIVSRLIYRFTPVRRGDIVAFTTPSNAPPGCRGDGIRLKRIVGLPGELVRPSQATSGPRGWKPTRVPPDHYFLLGDNPHGSCDSRAVGPVPKENLVGKVIVIYSPRWRLRVP